MLSNEDLVGLIQHSWRASSKGANIEDNHAGIQYDGTYETPEFVRKRSIWLSKIKSEYDNQAAYWLTNNKDCQYDMMQPPVIATSSHNLNTNIYCISPTFSLVTSSALSLIGPFTTSGKPSKGSNKNKGSGKKSKSKGGGGKGFHGENSSSTPDEDNDHFDSYADWLNERNNTNSHWNEDDGVYNAPEEGEDGYVGYDGGHGDGADGGHGDGADGGHGDGTDPDNHNPDPKQERRDFRDNDVHERGDNWYTGGDGQVYYRDDPALDWHNHDSDDNKEEEATQEDWANPQDETHSGQDDTQSQPDDTDFLPEGQDNGVHVDAWGNPTNTEEDQMRDVDN